MQGVEVIRAALRHIPTTPGIYQMQNAQGELLYVGKAKNLANRVANYASANQLTNRILRMVEQVAQVEIVVAKSEAEALLLEAAMIKRHKPRYNILLKDDKSFPFILFTSGHPFPRIKKHRGKAPEKTDELFGPFASAGGVNQALALLQKIFLLRPCSETIYKNRTRPCLQYQIKRCSAPCVGYITQEAYAEKVGQAQAFLRGKNAQVQTELAREMQLASEAMEYEKAAQLRDQIAALTQLQHEQSLRADGLEQADVLALARQGSESVVQLFCFRGGQHFGQQSYRPRHDAEASEGEIMAAFLGQFYQIHTPPPLLLLSHLPNDAAVLTEALAIRAGYAVEMRVPQRGEKKSAMTHAIANVQQALARLQQERTAIASYHTQLAKLFGLTKPPARIEVYDNSHIMGSAALGAMVVATPEGFDKTGYRTFTIKDMRTTPGDDYAMMREVFSRRFKPTEEARTLPDLVLIDGGKGQLSAVLDAIKPYNLQGITFVSIAKGEDRNAGREWFFMEGRAPFQLPENDALLHYLQRLRDEAHRFAIGKHRGRRSRNLLRSGLEEIPGIGLARKRALLNHFGSRQAIEGATIEQLQQVEGISAGMAKNIYDFFHAEG